MQNFDVIIIGAGSSGIEAALYARKKGLQVALIEKEKWGGNTVHSGGLQAKMLQKHAKIAHEIQKASHWGFEISIFELDYEQLKNKMYSIAMAQANKLYTKLKLAGVHCISGEAFIEDNLTVKVKNQVFSASQIVVATGSKPYIPDIPGLLDRSFLTTNELYKMDKLPNKMTIIGGGITAIETAFSLAPLGIAVTILEKDDDILLQEDPDIRHQLKKQLAQLNVVMLTAQQITEVNASSIRIAGLEIIYENLLIACGRVPQLELVAQLKLQMHEGVIQLNDYFQTSNHRLYIIGSAATPSLSKSKPFISSAKTVVNHIVCAKDENATELKIRLLNSIPEVADFGLNELQAVAAYKDEIKIIRIPINYAIDGIIEESTKCMLKLIVHTEFEEVVGAITIGELSTQIIEKVAMIVRLEGSLEEVLIHVDMELLNDVQQRKIV